MLPSMDNLRESLQERFSSVWKLLFDTDRFLSRTDLFDSLEANLRSWRRQLQEKQNDADELGRIRGEIVALRRDLRKRGYNLRLGSYDLEIAGFRSDDALGLGFARAVLTLTSGGMRALAGQANHNELQEYILNDIHRRGLSLKGHIHSLWYRWDNRLLRVSGADSEGKEEFEELRRLAEDREMEIIAAFRAL